MHLHDFKNPFTPTQMSVQLNNDIIQRVLGG